MSENKACRVCGDVLTSDNWNPSYQKKGDCICKECANARQRLRYKNNTEKVKMCSKKWYKNNIDKVREFYIRTRKNKGGLSMSENKECSSHYGVHINERLLKHYFNDVEVMPYGNPGYDFICNNGWKIDGKGSFTGDKGCWVFGIKRNTTADYFFCVAYDNRQDLNILHIWLLPGDKFNHHVTARISKSTINKWAEYEQPIGKVIACCDSMRSP